MRESEIGLIGLGTMGRNLARNIANKGYRISVYNRTAEVTESFIRKFGNKNLLKTSTLEEFIQSLETPRKVILMIKAGKAVDNLIDNLKPLLGKKDIIIDCGNSNFHDTERRYEELSNEGFNFIGCGISGGEEGALNGPSLMPGGNKEGWQEISEIFSSIAAKDFNNKACITYIGDRGAGHYVKMVHNGIEYGVMQIMAEAYDLLRNIYNLDPKNLSNIFRDLGKGSLSSYLFEISTKVLSQKDDKSENYLIEKILDRATQKGTGKWTAINALENSIATPTITEAVFARNISENKELRRDLSLIYSKEKSTLNISLDEFKKDLESGLYAAILGSYAQGFELIKHISKKNNWNINLSEVARIWQGGCIIRAQMLDTIHLAFNENKTHLFSVPAISEKLKITIPTLKNIVKLGIEFNIPVPTLSATLSYFNSITSDNLPTNFIQGLRDYFGAHTYERTDTEGSFHTNWN